ncbi:hypothetical protein [Caldanaerobacter sp.]|uniref:hypothetical protein n=1 Tax=Caldanaerobacter sp. TaxID=2930036 RepID=UPI003C77501F
MGKRRKNVFKKYMDSEFVLAILIMMGLLSIAVAQLFIGREDTQVFLDSNLTKEGKITIEVVEKDKASNSYILINGEPVSNFYQKSITITVKPNQIIEIDGTKEKEPLHFKVTSISDNVIEPQNNAVIRVDKNIQKVAMVKLK